MNDRQKAEVVEQKKSPASWRYRRRKADRPFRRAKPNSMPSGVFNGFFPTGAIATCHFLGGNYAAAIVKLPAL